ncbi:FAD-dependent oxidoreductase, partial [Mycobacterium tuberculosis]
MRAHLAEELRKRGVKVALSCRHERIEKREDGVLVSHVTDSMVIESEVVMFATGREPHVKDLGLDKAGVKLNDKGAVAVDQHSRTNVE